jgi:hypothetical protein
MYTHFVSCDSKGHLMTIHLKHLIGAVALSAGLAACSGTGAPVSGSGGDGLNRVVTIRNLSGQTVWEFYGSRVSTNSWEEDILGSNILRSGTDWNVNFDDGTGACNFDFKVVFENGTQRVENNINVCAISTFTIR